MRGIFRKNYTEVVHRAMLQRNQASNMATSIDKTIDACITHPIYTAFRSIGRAFKKQSTAKSYMMPRN